MKLAVALVALSVTIMIVMIVQTLRQELTLRNLKTRIATGAAEVKTKEEAIVAVKVQLQDLTQSLVSLGTKMDDVKKRKADTENSDRELVSSLETCNTQREQAKTKRSDLTESMNKLKADHEAAKSKAQQDIQSLKQQILDRDKAICAFVDTTKDEARKLCGL